MKLLLEDIDDARARRIFPRALRGAEKEEGGVWRSPNSYEPIVRDFGEVLCHGHLQDRTASKDWELWLIADRGRYGFLAVACGSCRGCDPLARCGNYREVERLIESLERAVEWFDTLTDARAFLFDDFERSQSDYFYIDGWSLFRSGVCRLEREASGMAEDEWYLLPTVAVAPEELRTGGDGSFRCARGSWLDRLFAALGEVLITVDSPCLEAADRGDTKVLLKASDGSGDRIGVLVVGWSIDAAAAALQRRAFEGGDTTLSSSVARCVRWFDALSQAQADVYSHFRDGMMLVPRYTPAPEFVRQVLALPPTAFGPAEGERPSERARRLFPEALSVSEGGVPWWRESYSYLGILWEFGDVLVVVPDEDYRGDTRALLRKRDRIGFLIFGWGSCSGCDALQACRTYREIEGLIRYLENGIRWFDSLAQAQAYVADDDGRQCSHYFHSEKWAQFRAEVLALPPSAGKAPPLYLEEEARARRLFPEAVSLRGDGDAFWEGLQYGNDRIPAEFGEVLVEIDIGRSDDDFRLTYVLLRHAGRPGLLTFCWSHDPSKDPLGLCRNYREIESLIAGRGKQIEWFGSMAEVQAAVSDERSHLRLTGRGDLQWEEFKAQVRALPADAADAPLPSVAWPRARRLFPEALRDDGGSGLRWLGTKEFMRITTELGHPLLELFSRDKDASLTNFLLLRRGIWFGLVCAIWGEGAPEDLAACSDYREIEKLFDALGRRIEWFDSLEALQASVAEGNTPSSRYAREHAAWPRFRALLLELPALVDEVRH